MDQLLLMFLRSFQNIADIFLFSRKQAAEGEKNLQIF
jgi:hypothetical protein